MNRTLTTLLLWVAFVPVLFAQEKVISRKKFFTQDSVIKVTLQTDLKKLAAQKTKVAYQDASITWHNADSTGNVTEPVRVRLRGNFRRENCGIASMMIDFETGMEKSRLKNFEQLKFVAPCNRKSEGDDLVLKEYLVYKIYNLITDKSFRVRLMQMTFEDKAMKVKPYTNYSFAIEPIDDLAKRNNSHEEDSVVFQTVETNKIHTTMVSIFQYMIGNTDWSIPNFHNIKLIISNDSPWIRPFVVPYDFDYCGAVNAAYAVPQEMLNIEKVTDRVYRGFPATIEEIRPIIALFQQKEPEIFKIIDDFKLLDPDHKLMMSNFLKEFFFIIKDEKNVVNIFIKNARKS
jgi:hypothetical protein